MKTAKEVIDMFENAPFRARHGDVILVRDDTANPGAVDAKGVVAEGEATGHAHRVSRAKVYRDVDQLIQRTVVAKHKGFIDHEEHKKSHLPKGTYRTGIQGQWSPTSGWSPVAD